MLEVVGVKVFEFDLIVLGMIMFDIIFLFIVCLV